MANRNEKLEKLDKERALKWRQEIQNMTHKPFDVNYCYNEEAILRERWKILHDECIASADNWTFVRAVFPDDARDYGVKIIKVNDSPQELKPYYKKDRLKIFQSFKNVKFFSVRQIYITNDAKVYIFVDLMGFKNFLSSYLQSNPIDNCELRAKIWSKSVLVGLSYLHSMGIAFGHNLNIDNIVVDNKEALKLFGLELYHQSFQTSGVKVLCELNHSNVQYLAPEAIKLKHDEICLDIFRFGVIVYYLMTNSFPFQSTEDPIQLRQQIIQKSWDNEKIRSALCKDLLNKIFVSDHILRATIDEIYSHQWFKIV